MTEELPGMLAVAKGVAEQTFPHTMDAMVWASEFAKINPKAASIGLDEGMMLGWFANAIMAGYDTARSRTASETARKAITQHDLLDATADMLEAHGYGVAAREVHKAKKDMPDCPVTGWEATCKT